MALSYIGGGILNGMTAKERKLMGSIKIKNIAS